jgi:hypothetical protein
MHAVDGCDAMCLRISKRRRSDRARDIALICRCSNRECLGVLRVATGYLYTRPAAAAENPTRCVMPKMEA